VQPGYLRELLPDSAPNQPETLQNVLDGEFALFYKQREGKNELFLVVFFLPLISFSM
jgi:hypothetical protein